MFLGLCVFLCVCVCLCVFYHLCSYCMIIKAVCTGKHVSYFFLFCINFELLLWLLLTVTQVSMYNMHPTDSVIKYWDSELVQHHGKLNIPCSFVFNCHIICNTARGRFNRLYIFISGTRPTPVHSFLNMLEDMQNKIPACPRAAQNLDNLHVKPLPHFVFMCISGGGGTYSS